MTNSIWATLSAIDCSDHIEQKGQFSYLAWTWAWAMVKQNYPAAQYKILKDRHFPGSDTMEVRVEVTIEDLSHTMWLPVLDFKNRPIVNPDSFEINTARMRCLVKALAMFGLGHYIYAGESAPAASADLQEKYERLVHLCNLCLAASPDPTAKWEFREYVDSVQAHMDELFNMAPHGKKTQFKQDVRKCYAQSVSEIRSNVEAIELAMTDPDYPYSVSEIFQDFLNLEDLYTINALSETQRAFVEANLEDQVNEQS